MRVVDNTELETSTVSVSNPNRSHDFNANQLRVLKVLHEVGQYGGLSRGRIAERIGYTGQASVDIAAGLAEFSKRIQYERSPVGGGTEDKPYLSLLSLGLVTETPLDIDGRRETIIQITEYGVRVYESLGVVVLPPIRRIKRVKNRLRHPESP